MPSAKYVCLLRGINVGGHKPMKMERLRICLESLGFKNVKTYLQSGNAGFEFSGAKPEKLPGLIGAKIESDFGFPVPIQVLSRAEIESALSQNPFLLEYGIDVATLHVTFLASDPHETKVAKLALLPTGADRWRQVGKTIYLHCPQGYGDSKLSNQAFERVLQVEATTRNWKTVNELARLLRE